MEIKSEFNEMRVEDLEGKITTLIAQDAERSHSEILTALIFCICNVVMAIECSDCRRLTAKNVKADLRSLLGNALAEAARRYANMPSGHAHH